MHYLFDTEIATAYGVNEAIMLQNIVYWINKNAANGKAYYDGRYWTYCSVEGFTRLFPFWTADQIRRILKSLEDKGAIISGCYNENKYDRTKWYALADTCICGNEKIKLGDAPTPFGENPKSIENIKEDIKEDSKENTLFPIVNNVSKNRSTTENLCLFANSRYADKEAFVKEFPQDKFPGIDINYYYHAVADWSASGGKKKRDWIATARNFMRADKEQGRLRMLGATSKEKDGLDYLDELVRSFGQ